MRLKNLIVCFFLILIQNLWATEFETTIFFNTESKDDIGGIEFYFSEQLSNFTTINAKLDYTHEKNYFASCSCKFFFNKFYINSGIAYDITNKRISPGFLIDSSWRILKKISIFENIFIGNNTNNLFQTQVLDGKFGITFHNDNNNLDFAYKFRYDQFTNSYNKTHYGFLDLTAFERGYPWKMNINSIFTYLMKSNNEKNFTLDLGASITYLHPKIGKYTIGITSKILDQSRTNPIIPITLTLGYGINLQ